LLLAAPFHLSSHIDTAQCRRHRSSALSATSQLSSATLVAREGGGSGSRGAKEVGPMPTCIFGVGPLGLVGPVAEAQLAPPKGRPACVADLQLCMYFKVATI
jgi:hypothetical protein